MITTGKSFNIYDYIEIILRRKWYILIPFIAIMVATFLYVIFTPREYRSSTLILVTPQKVPEEFVRPTVTSKIEDRLVSIGQEIMSRTRLEQVIAEFKLYAQEAKSLTREEIVELMRKNIQVEIKGKEGYFTISYVGEDPRVVTMVTNKLASLFIEENLKLREQQAQGTSEFLSIELNTTKVKLEEQEKALTQFKQKHMGELPEQRDANLKVLDQLQSQYQRVGDSLKAAQDRKLILQKQLSDFEIFFSAATQADMLTEKTDPSRLSSPSSSPRLNPYEVQLLQLKNILVELQAQYTEKHPDIITTRKKIADLEEKISKLETGTEEKDAETGKKAEKGGSSSEGFSIPQTSSTTSKAGKGKIDLRITPRYKEIENQVIATSMEIERFKEEEANVKAQIAKYRARIESTPQREQALTLLLRDYQNSSEAYQLLLKKSEGAQQAENLERRQKGEQFKVIDPARLPEKPFKPDIPKTLIFGLIFGVVGGLGTAFFREQMDRSFRDAEDLEVTMGYRVLANIPKMGIK